MANANRRGTMAWLFFIHCTVQICLVAPSFSFQYGSNGHHADRLSRIQLPFGVPASRTLPLSASSSEEDHDDESAPSLDGEDWRAFRANLVLGNQDGDSPATSSSWAYDSGQNIEPGSIILAKAEPDFCYVGLNQQYFHKSVMLVTYHKEKEFTKVRRQHKLFFLVSFSMSEHSSVLVCSFDLRSIFVCSCVLTKGIILNRPTNLFLGDEDFLDEDGEPIIETYGDNTTENSWRIWFGGDVRSLYSDDTEIVCLHSIDTDLSRNVSDVLLNNIMMTNYEGAIQMIDAKEAQTDDFWMFAGYAGWTGGQLLDELNRDSWYMVSADSRVVLEELKKTSITVEPRDAGLQTWASLMGLIDKEEEAKALTESFADLTLKEWANHAILFNSTAGSADMEEDTGSSALNDILSTFQTPDTLDEIVKLAVTAKNGLAGSLLRASGEERSPFLLSKQKFHKSTLLLLQDDEEITVGVMLNHPTTNIRPLALPNGKTVEMTIRYGGSFGIPGVVDQPTIFLHTKTKLKELSVGEPVGKSGADSSKVWICSEDQVASAIADGHATPHDFMCIEGFSLWDKDDGVDSGVLGYILEGKFELVESEFTEEIWYTLLAQASLSIDTIDRNCRLASDAWGVAGKNENLFPSTVYDSAVTVSELSDDANRYWIEAFLLGGVISAGKYSGFE